MKSFVTLSLLIGLASTAHAGGLNLSWNACYPDGGTQLVTSTCASNTGSQSMVGSFTLTAPQQDFVGIEVVWDACSMGVQWPTWWHFFNTGSCRQTSLSASAHFLADPPTQCVDPWQGQAAGGIAAYQMFFGAWDTVRLIMGFAVAQPIPMSPDVEYQGFRLTVDNQRTTGAGACAGCDVPVCVALNEIRAVQLDGSFERITVPLQSQLVSWQAMTAECRDGFIVPTRNVTWGRVKSLYR